jgi:hypothetical protein
VSVTPLDLAAFTRELGDPAVAPSDAWRCVPVELRAGELDELRRTCALHGIVVHDEIDRQVAELAQVRLPGAGDAERAEWVRRHVEGAGGLAAVGAWMHVPWERRVVHVLAESDFLDVVTDRNRDKITRAEQRLLRTKRVGVMGLSVGGEAALTVAQEHLCGAIVLADFDALDLSNLNRLGAGIEDLGVNKARIVARRIAKLDPWLDITIVEDGVTDDTVDAFLDGLDLLVEECDDLPMKWRIRELARARGIDIVFAADERGMLSIEPLSRMPAAAPFHGRVAGPPRPRRAYATPRAFMEALVEWLGGASALSARSRSSLGRIGGDLCGYPQLAGEARLAAAQVAHVARRLLLGERLSPRLLNVDLDALISASPEPARDGA